MSVYADFLASKSRVIPDAGRQSDIADLSLFDHQRALVQWALRRGRCALFADTGLGKTRMELAWAHSLGVDTLILTPLAVAQQMVAEGMDIGVDVNVVREGGDVRPGINVCNYERIHKLDCSRFQAVVLDESSVIKHADTRTFATLTDTFKRTPYRLCATATPAPNDWTELGTHAEFLGICSRVEMLSEFFVHDGGDTQVWRLKGHARREFWKWVAGWGAMVRMPSDLGFDDARYKLPELRFHEHTVASLNKTQGMLFALEAATLSDRRDARRESINERIEACVERVNGDMQPWVVWCDLNAESDALTKAIDGAVEVRGSMTIDEKESALAKFASGDARVIVTKPAISGWGLNWQHCARVAFVGVTDSWEAYYQAVRRCWRFGQSRPVEVHVFASEREGSVVSNLKRKETDAKLMAEQLSAETMNAVRESVGMTSRQTNEYNAQSKINVPEWLAA